MTIQASRHTLLLYGAWKLKRAGQATLEYGQPLTESLLGCGMVLEVRRVGTGGSTG